MNCSFRSRVDPKNRNQTRIFPCDVCQLANHMSSPWSRPSIAHGDAALRPRSGGASASALGVDQVGGPDLPNPTRRPVEIDERIDGRIEIGAHRNRGDPCHTTSMCSKRNKRPSFTPVFKGVPSNSLVGGFWLGVPSKTRPVPP